MIIFIIYYLLSIYKLTVSEDFLITPDSVQHHIDLINAAILAWFGLPILGKLCCFPEEGAQ